MNLQHPLRWKEYSALSQSEKGSYFDENVVHRNTTKSHFGGSQFHAQLFIDKGIVDVIIGSMLFQDDDSNDEITKERALSILLYITTNIQCVWATISGRRKYC